MTGVRGFEKCDATGCTAVTSERSCCAEVYGVALVAVECRDGQVPHDVDQIDYQTSCGTVCVCVRVCVSKSVCVILREHFSVRVFPAVCLLCECVYASM